ncbi:carbon-nitrogen hydrolase family protein [Kineococcus rhizosphaerae]|uniref:N-carbamoylputrescine amidase n=1 Tax=Kineococcus rhizosphaerae TaxID=559628 RepID=A0A2T0R8G9_9ACTN|nr:carbon-nitrogen hydrolase family protein [Kineococcus rhizosphaerae]PRY17473.1 N-carbamoylputrescine amidase [Kineococcus rhizosphaerae]
MSRLRAAVVQAGECTEDRGKNLDVLEGLVRAAARPADAPAPDLVLLPELITTPYFCTSRAADRSGWAQELPGPTTERFSALAAELGVAIVWGMYERTAADVLHNSAVAVDASGRLLAWTDADGNPRPAYRKLSLPANHVGGVDVDEKFFFTPGQSPVVLDLLGVRFAAVICYDRSFPEHWALARAMGADVVLAVVSSLGNREELFTTELQVRAMESQVFVLAANRAGVEHLNGTSVSYFGRSCAVDPTGAVLAQAPAHEAGHVLQVDLDLDLVRSTRARFPLLRDRRPDVVDLLARLTARS